MYMRYRNFIIIIIIANVSQFHVPVKRENLNQLKVDERVDESWRSKASESLPLISLSHAAIFGWLFRRSLRDKST